MKVLSRYIKLLCILLAICHVSAQQTKWNRLAPSPLPSTILGMHSTSSNQLRVVGDFQAMYETKDGGRNFTRFELPCQPYSQFHDITFSTNGVGVVVGSHRQIFRTQNNGASWTNISPSDVGLPSIDSGNSRWMRVFMRDSIIVVVGYYVTQTNAKTSGQILRSTNNGTTWTNTHGSTSLPALFDCSLSPDGFMIACGAYSYITSSRNFGATWTAQRMKNLPFVDTTISVVSQTNPLTSIIAISSSQYIVSGLINDQIFKNQIYSTNDGGASWKTTVRPNGITNTPIVAAYIPSSRLLFFSDSGGYIHKSSDLGNNWTTKIINSQNQSVGEFYVQKIYASPTSSILWASGPYGTLYMSRDNGVNWEYNSRAFFSPATNTTFKYSRRYSMVDNERLWYVHYGSGTMSRWDISESEAQGLRIFPDDTLFAFRDCHFFDKLNGYSVAKNIDRTGTDSLSYYYHLTTNDGGITWRRNTLFQDSVLAYDRITFSTKQRGFCYSSSIDGYMTTNDAGVTWVVGTSMNIPANSNIQFYSDSFGIAYDRTGFFARTNDGGLTWSTHQTYDNLGLSITDWGYTCMDFLNDSVGYISTRIQSDKRGLFLKTTNAGTTWVRMDDSTNSHSLSKTLTSIAVINDSTIVGIEQESVILSTNSGTTWTSIQNPYLDEISPRRKYVNERLFIFNVNSGWKPNNQISMQVQRIGAQKVQITGGASTILRGTINAISTADIADENTGVFSSPIHVYPNPARSQVSLSFTLHSQTPSADIHISSLRGSILYQSKIPVHSGLNTITIPLENAYKGVAFIRITNNSFEQTIPIIIE